MTTPEIVDEPKPEIIQNRFVPQPVKPESDKPKTASAPLIIRNPYVIQPEGQSAAALAVK
jgi:hypothetical protein